MEIFEAIESDDHGALAAALTDPASIVATTRKPSALGFERTYTPLSWGSGAAAVTDENARLQTLQMLLDAGCSAQTGAVLLECARPPLVALLLNLGAPTDQTDPDDVRRRTALACRLPGLETDAMTLLLQSGANPNATDGGGEPILFGAIFAWAKANSATLNVRKALSLLQSYALDINQTDALGDTLVMKMIRNWRRFARPGQFIEFMDEVLSRNPDLTLRNKRAENCLHLAAAEQEFREAPFDLIVRLMAFNAHYGINDFDLSGRTPIFRLLKPASFAGSLRADDRDLVKLFLARGAAASHQDNDGNSTLHEFSGLSCFGKTSVGPNLPPAPGTAERKVYVEILQALLAAGADRSLRNNNGKTALQVAEATAGNNCYDFVSIIKSYTPA